MTKKQFIKTVKCSSERAKDNYIKNHKLKKDQYKVVETKNKDKFTYTIIIKL